MSSTNTAAKETDRKNPAEEQGAGIDTSKMSAGQRAALELTEAARDAATERFAAAVSGLQLPDLDVLPALRAALPGPDLFFQQTVHLTPRGHEIVAEALDRFIEQQHLLDEAPARR